VLRLGVCVRLRLQLELR